MFEFFGLLFVCLEIALKYLKFYTKRTFLESEQTWPCAFYLLRSIWNYSDSSPQIAIVRAYTNFYHHKKKGQRGIFMKENMSFDDYL
jgi:hypothetical protein